MAHQSDVNSNLCTVYNLYFDSAEVICTDLTSDIAVAKYRNLKPYGDYDGKIPPEFCRTVVPNWILIIFATLVYHSLYYFILNIFIHYSHIYSYIIHKR